MARDIPGDQGRADEQLVFGYRVLSKSVLKSIYAASAAFESQRPGRTVRLLASRGGDVTCGLAEGQADLALVHLPLSLDLAFEELERHPFVVIAHKTPETHRREAYDLDELRHRRFILRPSNDRPGMKRSPPWSREYPTPKCSSSTTSIDSWSLFATSSPWG